MEKFKKAFKFQLKWLTILGLLAIIVGILIDELDRRSYKKITVEEFTKIAIQEGVTDFRHYNDELIGSRFEMRTPSGKKYYHDSYLFSDERFDFQNMIIEKFGSCGQGSKLSFYSSGMPIIIGLVVGILLFNAIILLWFVAFFNLLNSEFKENHNKWIWFISFIFLPLITPLYYMLISDKQKRDWTPK